MLVLCSDDVRRCLPMAEAIEGMKEAMAAVSDGRLEMPDRSHLDVPAHRGVVLTMPSFSHGSGGDSLAIKVVSLFDGNADRGLARIQATVLVLEPATGVAAALLHGATLTAIRTGAASGAAADLLARKDARAVAIFGAGVQGMTQLEAVCTVRDIEEVFVYDLDTARAEEFAVEVAGTGPIPSNVCVAGSPKEALADADIVCAATVSHSPIFDDADVRPGTHISAVGSYQPHVQELPAETVVRSRLVVDMRQMALIEPGDIMIPIAKGMMTPDDIHAELGEIVLGRKPGRENDEQITLFKSVGLAVQDAIAARIALEHARELGLGQQITW